MSYNSKFEGAEVEALLDQIPEKVDKEEGLGITNVIAEDVGEVESADPADSLATKGYVDGKVEGLATEGYVDSVIGDINTILDSINREVL